MPSAPRKPCTTAGCPELVAPSQGSKCEDHKTKRDSSSQRGYGTKHKRTFRQQVLARDPICVLCMKAIATEADHHPKSRHQLIQLGLNPDDPRYGRGLCHVCHSKATAQHQPGGWNAKQ